MNLKQELQSIYEIMATCATALIRNESSRAALYLGAATERMRELKDSIDDDECDQEDTDKKQVNDFFTMLQENFEQLKGKNGQKN